MAVLGALFVFAVVFTQRLWFVPSADSSVFFTEDEVEMHEASLGIVLGTVPQRLIWPGGMMRYVALTQLAASWLADESLAKSPDGFAQHVGGVLLSPEDSWRWMRLCSAFIASVGFAAPVWLAIRIGVPALWATCLAIAAAAFPLCWMSGCMATPDAMAWGLVLIALVVTYRGAIFVGAVIAGLAIGTKMTILPLLPALALLAVSRGRPVPRLAGAWCCGLLLGLLVANPYFLADPVRMIKTMVGVLRFKDGDFIGMPGALGYLVGSIPLWLVVLGLVSLVAAGLWHQRAVMAGTIISILWMILASAASKQVMERYFMPLGMLLLFLVLILLLPVLSLVKGRMRLVFSILVVMLAVGSSLDGWMAMQGTQTGMNGYHQAEVELGKFLGTLGNQRVALDSSLFVPHLRRHATAGRLDTMAEDLEVAHVAHRSVAATLSGFGFSAPAIRVFGGLFDEAEVNLAARLRAMAAASKGKLEMFWYCKEATVADGRLWQLDSHKVISMLQRSELDAVVFVDAVPASLAKMEKMVFGGATRKLYLIRPTRGLETR